MLLILPHGRGKLRHVVGKVEHGSKKRISSFPGRADMWALLLALWHNTYNKVSFLKQNVTVLSLPHRIKFSVTEKSFYHSDNPQLILLSKKPAKKISYDFYSEETNASQLCILTYSGNKMEDFISRTVKIPTLETMIFGISVLRRLCEPILSQIGKTRFSLLNSLLAAGC